MNSWSQTKLAAVGALTAFVAVIAVILLLHLSHQAKVAHYPNIQGAWQGTIEVNGKTLDVRLNLSKTNEGYVATADSPEQGVRNLPVNKLSYDYPALHFEIASIGGAFDGRFNAGADELSGTWKSQGTALPLDFKHNPNPAPETLADDDFASRPGSEVQGMWKGVLHPTPNLALRLNFKVAQDAGGAVKVQLDSVDQGVKDIEASSASYQDHALKVAFAGLDGNFEGTLDGKEISGTWTQAGKHFPLALERADEAQLEPAKVYFTGRNNFPGHWQGLLKVKNTSLHLVLHIAQLPDGSLDASMDSPDQGATGLPATEVKHTDDGIKIEWNAIGGVFEGALKNGKLTGKWRQGGVSLPLILNRIELRSRVTNKGCGGNNWVTIAI
jgi:hypothetical protein